MYSDCSGALLVLLGVLAAAGTCVATPEPATPTPAALRVCADPNNMPYSNAQQQGFENRIATLLARDFGRPLAYTWMPQRRGFVRNTLASGRCDVILGVPQGYGLAAVTTPYYRSTYVFVTRRDRGLDVASFDDPRLRTLRIGIHIIGADYANPPPAQALADRGITDNVRGYPIYGDYSKPDPTRTLIDALARGDVDVAVAWGPQAGYFARAEPVALRVTPVTPHDARRLPMTFAIGMGVRRDDTALKDALEREIARRREDIRRILLDYGVPLVEPAAAGEPLAPRVETVTAAEGPAS